MTQAAANIAADIRAYIAAINAQKASCRSDKDTYSLWMAVSADFNVLAKCLSDIAAFVANTNINPQITDDD